MSTAILDAPALVDAIVDTVTAGYVFPDRSADAADLLRARLGDGAYDLPVGPELCDVVSADLLAACGDRHLRLIWHEEAVAGGDEAGLVADLRELFRLENQGVQRVERRPGNVGLVGLTIVPDAASAGPALAAALRLVEHTHALILDLRETRGGAPDGVAFLASFLFPDGEVHLSDVVEGPHGPTRQLWTSGWLPGPRYGGPVWALTSASTFSGGEALAYDLQALGRATVVGEVTRGGAHPSTLVPLGEHVELRLPVARSVNPITGGNWEAVGVQPDVAVPAAQALEVAERAALEAIAADESLPAPSRTEAEGALASLRR